VTANGVIVATTASLTGKTFTGGVFNANDDTFGTPTAGTAIPSVIIYQHTGTNSTARLICHAQDYAGLPVTPDGINPIPIVWAAAGIIQIF
jgi:hypothetical protein